MWGRFNAVVFYHLPCRFLVWAELTFTPVVWGNKYRIKLRRGYWVTWNSFFIDVFYFVLFESKVHLPHCKVYSDHLVRRHIIVKYWKHLFVVLFFPATTHDLRQAAGWERTHSGGVERYQRFSLTPLISCRKHLAVCSVLHKVFAACGT